MNVVVLVLGILVFVLEGIPNMFVFVVCNLSPCKQSVPKSLEETRLMYILPSFSLMTTIYCISVRFKRTKLVNTSISLPPRDPPSIV